MNHPSLGRIVRHLLPAIALTLAWPVPGQEILLDRQTRAGELTLYPSVNDDSRYYYVADRAELARGPEGLPRFSFLHYVEASGGSGGESVGGGIVHALIELNVDQERVDEARRALSTLDGDGVIQGPVPFRSGKFALISTFAQEDGEFTDRIIGVGNAPLLEGQRAAVSLKLTRQGAEVLQGSLESPTPDLSFSFAMEIDGYRSPRQARLSADFERIYAHSAFSAGVATPYLRGEIETAFDDLRREGVIRLTEIGEEEDFDQLIRTAYDKLIELMFDRAPTTGTDALEQLQDRADGGHSLLDRAGLLLNQRRQETRRHNRQVRQRNQEQARRNAQAAEAAQRAVALRHQREEAVNRAENAGRLRDQAQARLAAYRDLQDSAADLTAEEQQALAQRIDAARRAVESYGSQAEAARRKARELEPQARQSTQQAEAAREQVQELEDTQELPGLAVVAGYRMKRSRVSGTFTLDLNKYTVATRTLRFDRNLGDLRPHLDQLVNEVDMDDTAFRRRKIQVITDGLDDRDFREFVNTITVVVEKERDDGSLTQRELSINRTNFNAQGNDFSLAYSRLGDEDSDFLSYRYEVLWNFLGGIQIDEPPRRQRGDIALTPPMTRRTLHIDADPDTVDEAGIRAIALRIFYHPGDHERSLDILLRPDGNGQGLSKKVDIILPNQRHDYAYRLQWFMEDGSRRDSGRVRTDQVFITADTLPEG